MSTLLPGQLIVVTSTITQNNVLEWHARETHKTTLSWFCVSIVFSTLHVILPGCHFSYSQSHSFLLYIYSSLTKWKTLFRWLSLCGCLTAVAWFEVQIVKATFLGLYFRLQWFYELLIAIVCPTAVTAYIENERRLFSMFWHETALISLRWTDRHDNVM